MTNLIVAIKFLSTKRMETMEWKGEIFKINYIFYKLGIRSYRM